MSNFDLMDVDTQKAVFSAAALMTIFFSVCLLSKWVLWGFFGVSLASTLLTGYNLFIKTGKYKTMFKKKSKMKKAEVIDD